MNFLLHFNINWGEGGGIKIWWGIIFPGGGHEQIFGKWGRPIPLSRENPCHEHKN